MKGWTIRTRRELGSPYVRHSIIVHGKEIFAALHPISDAEAADRVRQHLFPDPPRPVPPFPYTTRGRPKGSKRSTNDLMFNDDEAA